MPDFKTLNQELAKGLRNSIAYTDQRVGWLGKISAVDTIVSDPAEGLDQGFVWVRFDNNTEAIKARCHKVSARMPNMPVRVGRDAVTKEWTIIEIVPMDWGEINDLASTFSVPDRNPDYIYEEFDANRFKDLHVEPGTDAFDVKVEPGFYWWHGEIIAFEGETINIAASVPVGGGFGGSKRGVLIGIDPATNTLTTYDGDVQGILVTPGNSGKYFTASYIADTVNAADPDVYWIALIPITSTDSNWSSLYRVTALTLVNGLGVRDFVDLGDVPSAYTGHSLKAVRVNAGETGLEFFTGSTVTSLDDLSDVVITSPSALDALYFDGANWVNGDVYVRNTGDSMTGGLSIISTEPSLLTLSTLVGVLGDAATHGSILASFGLNQNGQNYTSPTAAVGARGVASVSGASGTVTGAAGVTGQVTKTGLGTLTGAASFYADTITKSAGTLTNAIGLYLATQTAGTNNYGIYQDGAGLNLLTDGLVVNGSTTGTIQQIIRGASGQTANLGEFRVFAGTPVLTIGTLGNLTVAPIAATAAPGAGLTLTAAAHTALTASTEYTDVNLNLARTVQFATGALTTQRAVRIQAPTYSAVGSSTITTAVTLDVSGAPAPGTNVTITNAIAVRVGGRTQINGTVDIVPPVATSGHLRSFLLTAPAHTGVSAGEYIDVDFALNRNVQFTTGSTIGTNRAFVVRAPTYIATSATQTITTAYTFEITGPPVASTNVSITNSRSFHVASGVSTFDGQVQINALTVIGDGQNISVGSSSGTRFGTSSTQKMGWWDAAAVVRDNGWTVTNPSALRTIDATTATLDDCRRVIGTIITVMKTYGLLGG